MEQAAEETLSRLPGGDQGDNGDDDKVEYDHW